MDGMTQKEQPKRVRTITNWTDDTAPETWEAFRASRFGGREPLARMDAEARRAAWLEILETMST